MGVDVHGHRDGRMPQPLADDLGRHPGGQGGAGVAVPQIMQPDLGQAGAAGVLLEPAFPLSRLMLDTRT
jgi:hypothetical protein